MKLKEYRKKRDFSKTTEPKPGATDSSDIFVIQKHHASHLHYDFRLAIDGVLKSWAVPKGVSNDPKVKRLAVMTEDHPLEYAEFEGVIPKEQYGAGKVEIWDKGTWESVSDLKNWEKTRKLEFNLHGKKLEGTWVLIGLKDQPKNWLLFKKVSDHLPRSDT